MGYSVSWLAVRGKDANLVRQQLGLQQTGQREEIPESPVLGSDLPTGWYLVFANRCDYAENAGLDRLSVDCEVVACSVEEHVMVSAASGWKDGRNTWAITHDSQRGPEDLEVEGEPPSVFSAIRERLNAQQAERGDADYIFDIPVEVAESLTGFRHDEDIEHAAAEPFEVLAAAKTKRWWQIWK